MKKFILLLQILLVSIDVQAQIQSNNWLFGDSLGLSFNINPPSFFGGGALSTYEGCSSISDGSGNLLFYSDGITVWTSTHTVMSNGTGLLGDASSSQSALIVPAPGSSTLFYIITAPEHSTNNPLAYSVVDISLGGGQGSVTVKNVSLLPLSTEKVTAVHHQNGVDIWIIVHGYPNANFYAYLLTASGINSTPVISTIGNPITILEHKIGILKASPCGSHVAMTNQGWSLPVNSTLELFDFNNATGQLSNSLLVGDWFTSAFGLEFSPDNSKLYLSFTVSGTILQYDLSSGVPATIIASADTIGQAPFGLTGSLQLASDGRIYIARYSENFLDCISNPNIAGVSCGYVFNYLSLPNSCFLGLPGFLTSWFCNIPSGLTAAEQEDINIFPNPFTDEFTITGLVPGVKIESLLLFDMLGRVTIAAGTKSDLYNHSIQVYPGPVAEGIYMLEIKTSNDLVRLKVMKKLF